VTAVALDLAAGELPSRWHPVAWLGRGIAVAEARLPVETAAQRWRSGFALAGVFVGGAALVATATPRLARRRLPAPLAFAAEAVLLKQAFAIRSLFTHVAAVERPLRGGDIEGGRRAAGMIVSRSTAELPAAAVASAAIESLAENASDSVVAPLLWYTLLGLPGAFAYRAINTLDAIVGYRSKGVLGTPSARLDDAANLVPARLTAALIAATSGQPLRTARGTLTDAGRTPSPNAGWPMAAAAHALGLRLEKREHHILNTGAPEPGADDIARARRLLARALVLGGVLATLGLIRSRRLP
jgi:adenosylcobinamide-phosphate synthase